MMESSQEPVNQLPESSHPAPDIGTVSPPVNAVHSDGFWVKIWICLLALTAVTVGASHIHFGGINVWVALAVATVKASLIVLFFMHLREEDRSLQYMFLAACVLLTIFIGFTFLEVLYR